MSLASYVRGMLSHRVDSVHLARHGDTSCAVATREQSVYSLG